MSDDGSQFTGTEIAVVGMAVRAPGASTLDEFWRNLVQGVESVRRFSDEELLQAGESREHLADPRYVPVRPYLDDVDRFDASFFGLSPQDAAITDPQHRIFLEVGWEALEHAGYAPSRIDGQVGVFATCGMNSYMMYHLVTNPRLMRTVGEWLIRHTGNDMSFLATSLSYHLDLKGPSLNVQCACSSALVAIHMAAQSLLSGECDMALAGGSVVVLPQERGYLHEEGEILARDGHCRPFDANASGTLFGSGAGVVVLRRLTDALAARDNVLAIIKGSAINNDGAAKVGYLAPSVEGQSRAIAEALAVSGVDAETISYVEAHGTGTIVGDPIEVTALTEAFRRHTDRKGFCRLGSLKSNVGHLGEAAGALAFIKTVLSLQHRQLPPSLNYTAPNPQIDFASTPFVVNDALVAWTGAFPRRAGVTALGAGGTNCHVILEEAPAPASVQATGEQLLVLSAKTSSALATMRSRLASTLEHADAPALGDVSYTLRQGRDLMPYAWSAACGSREEAVAALRGGGQLDQTRHGAAPTSVVFLFPGGGAQYPNMGRGLYETEPVFKDALDRCFAILETRHGIDLRAQLFPETADESAAADLARPLPSILSVFAIEYALARLWMSWGVTPAAMSGHSLGEYVAACLAGVFSLDDALAIVKARGELFEQLPPGAMLSVLLPEQDIAPLLDDRLSIAAVNAASACVVSGPVEDIARLDERLRATGVETQRLHIAVAAHSPMLEPMLEGFRRIVASVRLSPPSMPIVSNRTGRWMTTTEATDPTYWVRHLRDTVRFHEGLSTILENPNQILLEVGPGRALTSLARQHTTNALAAVTSLRHPSEIARDTQTMMAAAGRLWLLGARPRWTAIQDDSARRHVPLPTYPFERERYWIDPPDTSHTAPAEADVADADTRRKADIADWFFRTGWTATALPSSGATAVRDVILFCDDGTMPEAIGPQLRQESAGRCYVVGRGDAFARLGEERFVVNPLNADDYAALFAAIGDGIGAVTHIVYGWTLPADGPAGASNRENFEQQLDRYFFGPLALAQGIGRQEIEHQLTVAFVTRGLAQIAGETALVPAAATLLGPSRVLPRELPTVVSRVIDVGEQRPSHRPEALAGTIARDIASGATDAIAAYRGNTRWVETLSPYRLERGDFTTVRRGGTYLITGGLGDLGLALASYLARRHRANLVLVGRSALPPRDAWTRWLDEHPADDLVARRIAGVLECESHDGRVLVVAADVADADQLAAARAQAIEAFGTVHGVIHAAGVLDDGLMVLKTRESVGRVLRPKIEGAVAIDQVFGRDQLDFIALFSSISSVLGLQGQADYTAGNAFLDVWATATASDRPRTVSIGWGPWRDVGLAATAATQRHQSAGRQSHYRWFDRVRELGHGNVDITLRLARGEQWVIGEHVVHGGDAVLPGTGYLELATAAMREIGVSPAMEISNVLFQAPLVVPADETVPVTLTIEQDGEARHLTWHSDETVFATADVAPLTPAVPRSLDVDALRARCARQVREPRGFLDQPFMDFGQRWANIERIGLGAGEAILDLALPETYRGDTQQHLLHPALLDMATGGAQALIPGFDRARDFYVPFSYQHVRVFAGLPPSVVSHVRVAPGTSGANAVFDVTIADTAGTVVAEITGFCMRRVAAGAVLSDGRATSAGPATTAVTAPPPSAAAIADAMLFDGMRVDEGMEAIERVLAGDAGSHVLVMTGDLAGWRRRVDAASRSESGAAGMPARDAHVEATAHEDFDDVERTVAVLWRELLGVEASGRDANFFSSGGHSLLAVRLMSRIERQFHAGLPIAAIFDAPTLGALAEAIRTQLTAPVDTAGSGGRAGSRVSGATAPAAPMPALVAVPRESFRTVLSDLLDDESEE